MNANSTRNVVVEAGGDQVVGHVGLHALGSFADRLGVGDALSQAVGWSGPGMPVHDRGRVLTQTMLMLAGGGESCADIEALASQPRLFGVVCSDSTLYRTFTESLDTAAVRRAWSAMAGIRTRVWSRIPALVGDGPLVLDVDASLIEIHSENKEGTASNFKHGFGFHPVFCFADATGETLAASLRPGNATANDSGDLLGVVDAGISQLPEEVAQGHREHDDPELVVRHIVVRSDSAGASKPFVEGCRDRNIGFQVVARKNAAISGAIAVANADSDRWQPALDQDGTPAEPKDGQRVAEVCEVTDLVDLDAWPKDTRLIVRREPLHPGAQQSLLPDLEYRFWGHYTDQKSDPAELDRLMRAHAHVEDNIQRLKDSGLMRFPFTDLGANQAWLHTVCWAADLVRWFQMLCLTGSLAKALPKRLRWTIWHTPARIIRSARRDVVRILDGWPTAKHLLGAYQAIAGFA
jgi:hypothetical protein